MTSCEFGLTFRTCAMASHESANRLIRINDPGTAASWCTNQMSSTKYSVYNFLCKNLAEQFSRHINRYFLLIASLQLWSDVTPVHPVTTWAPLIFIFAVTAAKEAVDDCQRASRDRELNNRQYTGTSIREWRLMANVYMRCRSCRRFRPASGACLLHLCRSSYSAQPVVEACMRTGTL